MNGVLLSLLGFAVVAAAVICAAAGLVFGALGAAAVFPRGSSVADALRRFADGVPRHVWRAVRFLDGLVFATVVVLAIAITLAFS